MDTFGTNLIKLRKEKGVTQADLADGIGASVKTIRRYEHEESLPDAEMIRRIARYLDVSSDRLLREREPTLTDIRAAERRVARMVFSRLYEGKEPGTLIFMERDQFMKDNKD